MKYLTWIACLIDLYVWSFPENSIKIYLLLACLSRIFHKCRPVCRQDKMLCSANMPDWCWVVPYLKMVLSYYNIVFHIVTWLVQGLSHICLHWFFSLLETNRIPSSHQHNCCVWCYGNPRTWARTFLTPLFIGLSVCLWAVKSLVTST